VFRAGDMGLSRESRKPFVDYNSAKKPDNEKARGRDDRAR
jgi:hypothetical protein